MANEDLQVTIGANIDDLMKELRKAKKGLSGFQGDLLYLHVNQPKHF